MLLTLDQARNHLRAQGLDDDDDLTLKISAVGLMAQEYTGRQIYPTQDDLDAAVAAGTAGDSPMVVTDLVRLALLLMLGTAYENRSDVVVGGTPYELPNGSRRFLEPYRKGMGV